MNRVIEKRSQEKNPANHTSHIVAAKQFERTRDENLADTHFSNRDAMPLNESCSVCANIPGRRLLRDAARIPNIAPYTLIKIIRRLPWYACPTPNTAACSTIAAIWLRVAACNCFCRYPRNM